MRRAAHTIIICGAAAALGAVRAEEGAALAEPFDRLDPARWEVVRVHDVRAERVTVDGGRLALSLDTLGTDDATVKLRGLRSRAAFEVSQARGVRVQATIDWNAQSNGCYLTCGLALVPEDAAGSAALDPRDAPEALAFELVGVPPGKNVRPSLWRRASGGLRPVFSDGWPQDRRGRAPRALRITLEVTASRVRLLEDDHERFAGEGGFAGRLRLMLFVTGHSNYPERTVYMDDVRVEALP